MQDLDDIVDPLLKLLNASNSPLVVRLAAARTLVDLDARSAADALAKRASADGLDMALLVEPALAKWNHAPRRTVWRKQLSDPILSRRRLILAIRALGQVRDNECQDALLALALDPSRSADVRLEAARSRCQIAPKGLGEPALKLLSAQAQPPVIDRLVAAELASHDSTPRGKDAIEKLLDDPEPAVVAVALEAASQTDPQLALKHADRLINSDDANVRRLTATLLVAHPSENAVKLVGRLLTDPQPGLIEYAGQSLATMAKQPELTASIHQVIAESLASSQPATVRQAVLLVGALRAKEFASRTTALLDDSSTDVATASAWALRMLADPSTEPAILARIDRESKRRLALVEKWRPIVAADPYGDHDFPSVSDSNAQLEQLVLALGVLRSRTAEPLLRSFLPKPPRPQIGEPPVFEVDRQASLRAAAIWSLGLCHAADAPAELCATLRQRLDDANEKAPEAPLVRRMAAVSLGRMKDPQSVSSLRPLTTGPDAYTELGRSCRWALQEITSEKLAALEPLKRAKTDWFLTPLN
jgi:HEAT repeat protein